MPSEGDMVEAAAAAWGVAVRASRTCLERGPDMRTTATPAGPALPVDRANIVSSEEEEEEEEDAVSAAADVDENGDVDAKADDTVDGPALNTVANADDAVDAPPLNAAADDNDDDDLLNAGAVENGPVSADVARNADGDVFGDANADAVKCGGGASPAAPTAPAAEAFARHTSLPLVPPVRRSGCAMLLLRWWRRQ